MHWLSADHTIAHELGHITMNTHDEEKSEKKGQSLLKDDQFTVATK